jgi:hypothetical protein
MRSESSDLSIQVTWDTWSSKLDSMWNPVLTIRPMAQGQHIFVAPYPFTEDIELHAKVRRGCVQRSYFNENPQLALLQDMHGEALRFRIVHLPEHGKLNKEEGEAKFSCRFQYRPKEGFTGTDYFTFIATNAVRT